MHITLIRPPILVPENNMVVQYTPPIGLAYLAGSIQTAGFDVQVIDGLGEDLDSRHVAESDCFIYGLTIEEVIRRIPEYTNVIGISAAFSFEWPLSLDLIKQIRERFPETLLIGGGEHVTALPEESLLESELDIGVLGEGEEIIVHTLQNIESGNYLSQISGIVYKESNGQIIKTARHDRIRNLDEIPLPAWDMIPIENYLDRQMGFGVNRGRSMPLLASRGCPYQCTFCSNPNMWTTRWIARSTDLLLDEITLYQKKYRVVNFDFYDLTAIVRKKWILEFCDKIKKRGMNFTWQLPSGSRSEAIDADVAEMIYNSGCRNLSFSPESGSASVLKRIKKRIKTSKMLNAMSSSIDVGINVKANIIFGFPEETYREIWESYEFIAQMALIGVHDLAIWAFSPYPGSEIFNQLRHDGEIGMDSVYYDKLRSYSDNSSPRSYSKNISDRQLKLLRTIGTLLFYGLSWLRHPSRPFIIIRNVLRGEHESRGEMVLERRLRGLTMKNS